MKNNEKNGKLQCYIDHDLLNKLFLMLEKLQRAYHTFCGHFAPTYLGGSNKLRAYLLYLWVQVQPKSTEYIYIDTSLNHSYLLYQKLKAFPIFLRRKSFTFAALAPISLDWMRPILDLVLSTLVDTGRVASSPSSSDPRNLRSLASSTK